MTVDLAAAFILVGDRFQALAVELDPSDPDSAVLGELGDERSRLLMSGLDVDMRELEVAMRFIEERGPVITPEDVEAGREVGVTSSLWLHGFMTGLIAASRPGKPDAAPDDQLDD